MFPRFLHGAFLQAPVDGDGGGAPPPAPPGAPPAPDDRLQTRLEAAIKKAEKLETAQKAREKAEADATEAKRLADEGASKLLDERNAQLAAVNARLQAIEAKEMERAAKLLDRVPEGLRAQLEAFKGDMPTEKWVALVEASAQPAGTPTPPAMGSGGDRGANGQHQASSGTMEVLDSLGAEPKALGLVKLAKESDPDSGAMLTKFTIPIKTMMRTLRKYDPIPVTLESARERGGKR